MNQNENELQESRKITEQEQIRLNKVEELKKLGIDPFGGKFNITHYSREIKEDYEMVSKDELEEKNTYLSKLNKDKVVIVENVRKTGTVTLTKEDEKTTEKINRQPLQLGFDQLITTG